MNGLGRSSGVDPRCEQARHRIGHVGTIWVDDDGAVNIDHWSFEHNVQGMDEVSLHGMQFPEYMIDGMVAGWTPAQLHDIAHGYPCHCPVRDAMGGAA